MNFDLSPRQCEMLRDLLEAAHRDITHELHRTDALGYKAMLRQKIRTVEELRSIIAVSETVA